VQKNELLHINKSVMINEMFQHTLDISEACMVPDIFSDFAANFQTKNNVFRALNLVLKAGDLNQSGSAKIKCLISKTCLGTKIVWKKENENSQ
jgi:hypothetical protein